MKLGFIFILLLSQSAHAQMFWWSACKKNYWHQYEACVAANDQHWEPLKKGAEPSEIAMYEESRVRANDACLVMRRENFALCRRNKRAYLKPQEVAGPAPDGAASLEEAYPGAPSDIH